MSEEPFISVQETNTSPAVVALLEVMRSPEHLIHRGLFTAFLKCALTRGFTGRHAVCE